jgi:hypothetical protein
VNAARNVKHALANGGFTGVNVRHDSDVSDAVQVLGKLTVVHSDYSEVTTTTAHFHRPTVWATLTGLQLRGVKRDGTNNE